MSTRRKNRKNELIKFALNKGEGVIRLAPAWVPRPLLTPGGRLKLATSDLYVLGTHRGGIDERWLASTTNADNGPGTPEDEGLSYIVIAEGGSKTEKILLKEAIELKGDLFLGKKVMEKHKGWEVLTKFFDNLGPIPHHMHQMEEHAKKVGRKGKPEAYYYPVQMNFISNNFPYTFFGLEPGTTKDDIINCLKRWDDGDNEILYYSKAYKLKPGTGWNVPAGILHAPGSLVTYEPQKASDVSGMFQSMVEGRHVPREFLLKNVPVDLHNDFDYLISMLDWKENVDPNFKKNHYLEPKPVHDINEMREKGYIENWIVYGSPYFSAKELTIFPGRSVVIKDNSAYGLIAIQGRGKIGKLDIETPTLIHFGELTDDEFFVTESAGKIAVTITNTSKHENLVMLKHFGPS